MSNSIVPVLANKIPEFVRESYPNFVRYIHDYLTWLEQDENFLNIVNNWKENNEPSLNVEPYVTAILTDMGFPSGQGLEIGKGLMLNVLRDFYLARGSESSFKLLFRVLFNEDVEVRYPREEMLIPSYAEYGERHFIFTSALNRNMRNFSAILDSVRENGGTIRGVTSRSTASIQDIFIVYGQGTPYLQIEILEPLNEFLPDEQAVISSSSTTMTEQIQPVLSVRVVNAGSGYRPGEIIEVAGSNLIGRAVVGSVRKSGIDQVSIAASGSGYSVGDRIGAISEDDGFGFSAYVSGVDGSGGITDIVVSSEGYNYGNLPDLTINSSGDQAILVAGSTSVGAITNVEILDPFVDFDQAFFSVVSEEGQGAILESVPVSRWVTRSWSDNRGFLEEASTLIDSDKYQQFSYTLVSSIPSSQYNDYVDDLLHPVGYIRGSSIEIVSEINLELNASGIDGYVPTQYIYESILGITFTSEMDIEMRPNPFIVTEDDEAIITEDDGFIVYT